MAEISSIKPAPSEGMTRPVPKIAWNKKTEQSLKQQGEVYKNHTMAPKNTYL